MDNASKVSLVVLMIAFWFYTRQDVDIRTDSVRESYDYVIVGAGTAGSVLAARLSEDPDVSVLLLEAGKDDVFYPDIKIPYQAVKVLADKTLDWDYKTVPQKHSCLSAYNRQCTLPRGKVLGGSGSVNCLIYLRGHPQDFDRWSTEFGSQGWSYEDVLPYFTKSEKNLNPVFAEGDHHGTEGPMAVSDANATYGDWLKELFLRAADELGYLVGDINAGHDVSGVFMQNQVNVGNGLRHSTAGTFLRPAAGRHNLDVLTEVLVTKVILDGNTATGVEYEEVEGHIRKVKAKREVILSAGTIGSAQILMLSGIGPRDHLLQVGVEPRVDLPVGSFLQDHMYLPLIHFITNQERVPVPDAMNSLFEHLKYKFLGVGPLAHACNVHGHAVFRSKYQPPGDKRPYFKLCFHGGAFGDTPQNAVDFAAANNLDPELVKLLYSGIEGRFAITIIPDILRPRSSGTLRLRTADLHDEPLIDPDYLSDPFDVKVFTEAIRMAHTVANTTAFRNIGATARAYAHPSCGGIAYDTDPYWECIIRQMAFSEFHPVGTCRMGASDDPKAVVDHRLRVRHVSGLRVIDASVMPEVLSGNTNAAAVMIAERGADLVKEDAATK